MSLETFVMTAIAGLLATYGLITVALVAPRIGLPRIDFARAMADLYWAESFDGKAPFWMGNAIIYVNGIIFALIYATWVGQLLPGHELVRGLIWGGILYIGAEIIFVPIFLRGGLFSLKAHKMAWLTSLLVHAVWGFVVGWLSPVL